MRHIEFDASPLVSKYKPNRSAHPSLLLLFILSASSTALLFLSASRLCSCSGPFVIESASFFLVSFIRPVHHDWSQSQGIPLQVTQSLVREPMFLSGGPLCACECTPACVCKWYFQFFSPCHCSPLFNGSRCLFPDNRHSCLFQTLSQELLFKRRTAACQLMRGNFDCNSLHKNLSHDTHGWL